MVDLNLLTKEKVIELALNSELADYLELKHEDTTTGMNGYPKHVREAIVSDSLRELSKIAEHLKSLGFEVALLELHRKDGWHLWNRKNIGFFTEGMYMQTNDSDYSFEFDHEWSEEEAKREIAEFFFSRPEEILEGIREKYESEDEVNEAIEAINKKIDDLYMEMKRSDCDFHFIDMDNQAIDYSVSSDSAGYYYDTNYYQLAIMVEDFDIDENED